MKATFSQSERIHPNVLALAAWAVLSTRLPISTRLNAAPIDFTVVSPINGKSFKRSDAEGKFVVLHFLLKTECPYCLRHTRDYAVKSAGVSDPDHVFLKSDEADEIKAWSEKLTPADGFSNLVIYQDPQARLADQLGIPGGYQFHGQTVHYPALVVLDPKGNEVFRYVGKSNADRLSYEQFTVKLAELRTDSSKAIAHYNLGSDKLALAGYDPVAYFTEGKAAKGKQSINTSHRGVTYHFSTEDNRRRFIESPAKYVPAYGGWCATAMAKGEKVEIDPTNFKITNGRLFLFFKAFYANALKDWNKEEPALIPKADGHWKTISGE